MSRVHQIILFIIAAPLILVEVAVALLYVGDDLRFASLKHYSSELTFLPAPATLDDSSQNSNSSFGDGGIASGLYIYRGYTLKSSVSPQVIYNYYNSQLVPHGWSKDVSQTSFSPGKDTFTWKRAGAHNDTLSYNVTYQYGGVQTYEKNYPNLLQLQIQSDPNGSFNLIKNVF